MFSMPVKVTWFDSVTGWYESPLYRNVKWAFFIYKCSLKVGLAAQDRVELRRNTLIFSYRKMRMALIQTPQGFSYYSSTATRRPKYKQSKIGRIKMRKIPTISLISAAAAFSFFCASMVMAEGPSDHSPVIVASSR